MAHHLAHRDLGWIPRQQIAAPNTRRAAHPTLRLAIKHDLFEKAFRCIVSAGELADGDWRSAKVIDQREQSPQCIIRLF